MTLGPALFPAVSVEPPPSGLSILLAAGAPSGLSRFGRSGAPLGNARTVPAAAWPPVRLDVEWLARREARGRRALLRRQVAAITRLGRVASCMRPRGASAVVRDAEGVCFWRGLETCGSVWSCPSCSARVRAERAAEVEQVGLAHLAAGGGLAFLTLTLRHFGSHPLKLTLGVVQRGMDAVYRDRRVRHALAAAGVIGYVRATEITRGDNGWHPHLHALLFSAAPIDGPLLLALEAAVFRAWAAFAAREGLPVPSRERGARLQVVAAVSGGASSLALYLTKVQDTTGAPVRSVGGELVRGDLKRGRKGSRVPFDIAASAYAGNAADLALWHEYERVTRGRRCMEWSRGLRARYPADPAEPAPAPALVAMVWGWQARALHRAGLMTRALEVAEDGGATALAELIERVVSSDRARAGPGRWQGGGR